MSAVREGLLTRLVGPNPLARWVGAYRESLAWARRRYAAPSPTFIKHAVLLRNAIPDAVWVESGTYLGQTTVVLARHGRFVHTIEPEPDLYRRARDRCAICRNVEVIRGLSEEVFPVLLPTLSGDVNFWLDGHYSAEGTFRGPHDTPIRDELRYIADHLPRFGRLCVMVDDVRCFDPSHEGGGDYPPLQMLVRWAEALDLRWHIEHDIFVARTRRSSPSQ